MIRLTGKWPVRLPLWLCECGRRSTSLELIEETIRKDRLQRGRAREDEQLSAWKAIQSAVAICGMRWILRKSVHMRRRNESSMRWENPNSNLIHGRLSFLKGPSHCTMDNAELGAAIML